ncbi:hypothetical protein I3843_10G040300 [Carya illinoinensis]|uniref:F-box domain-containing protein n=1 Tax=Carya illinoinensis TaxID=32201 RepID=A0A922J1L6_CARIL|nr:hypothetical protein I3760_10G040100 [Carya illinoinensis]KAG6690965.1 hypothetical protein I3842_10G040000 [Carya illinoinensis]KAG7958860.1 hypothetical protein I3843_10G040300 [Carya illinoinensis]
MQVTFLTYNSTSHVCFICDWFLCPTFPFDPTIWQLQLCTMFYFIISCVSFILISKSFTHKPQCPWKEEMKLLLPWFWRELSSSFLVSWIKEVRLNATSLLHVPILFMPFKKIGLSSKVENIEEEEDISLLDLPDLALECILDRLLPSELCSMAAVCSSLRDRCRTDHFWDKHMKHKWGGLMGDAAYREWQRYVASRKTLILLDQSKKKGFFESTLQGVWTFPWFRPKLESSSRSRSSLPVDSIMAWYLSLESGKIWFPAQVYNRENGNVGFLLSCYDALLRYDSQTDTFQARYSAHGRRTQEENIEWDRLRAPPVDTPPYVLHVSDCLNELKPGDHIEIQWRRKKEFPHGWWYAVISHLERCDRNENHCCCHHSGEKIILDSSVMKFSFMSLYCRGYNMLIMFFLSR